MGSRSKKRIALIMLLSTVIFCAIYSHELINNVVNRTVSTALNSLNAKKEFLVSIEKIDVNVFKGSIYLKGISLTTSKKYYEKFTKGKTPLKVLTDFHISEIALTSLNFKKVFWDKEIDSTAVLVENLSTNIYVRKHNEKPITDKKESSSGLMDSLHIRGMDRIDLGPIKVNSYQLNLLDADSKDTISSYSGNFLELDGVRLEKYEQNGDVFKLQTKKIQVTLKDQIFRKTTSDMETILGSLKFNNSERTLRISNFRYRPTESLKQMASRRKYADNLFDVNVKSLLVEGFNIEAYRENHLGSIKSILIDGMELKMLKNKQKPENTGRRPLLPQQNLKKLNYPIHIEQILIKNSYLSYKEVQPKDSMDVLIANLTHLNAEINNVTSIKDSLQSNRPLTISISSQLMGKTRMGLTITMPYNHRKDAFHYKGSIGSADLKIFNPLLIPAANISVEHGHLESIHFEANATPLQAVGTLTMRYSDFKVDVPSKNKDVEHTLSFLASSLIHRKNPKSNGKVRVAEIVYDRPPHKGLGGQITKSVLSGVINTIKPFGKQKKDESKKHMWFKKRKRS